MRAFDATPDVMEAPIAVVLIVIFALIGFQTWALYQGQQFDPQGFGYAVGAIIGGGGVASFGQGYVTRSRQALSGSSSVDSPD